MDKQNTHPTCAGGKCKKGGYLPPTQRSGSEWRGRSEAEVCTQESGDTSYARSATESLSVFLLALRNRPRKCVTKGWNLHGS